MVVNGVGASAIACTKLYVSLGVKKENILMCDKEGVIRKDREKMDESYCCISCSLSCINDIHKSMAWADMERFHPAGK